uniref:DUF1122 domain-containing protein n=1 Tax=Ignisphaera aggregans TaxID=334771 RepID=A0A7C5UYF1_9CREN
MVVSIAELVKSIEDGFIYRDVKFYGCRIRRGRFAEEVAIDMCIEIDKRSAVILYMKIFTGREPYYRKWIEIFNIMNIKLDEIEVKFYETPYESWLLDKSSQFLQGGEKLFVEYIGDFETSKQLERGYPIVASRLGYEMFLRGFTWFKNWYFPEGFMEGNPKIQGEKPVDLLARKRHLNDIFQEVKQFIEWFDIHSPIDSYEEKAYRRAKNVYRVLKEELAR